MKALTNLNLLDTDKLLIDDEDRIFVVLKCNYDQRDRTCYLELIELTHGFLTYSMTFPIACDRDTTFTSINDKEFKFKFYELEVTKNEISKLLEKEARASIDAELKKQK